MSVEPAGFMRRAIELARRGFPAPNPRVGCVVVRKGSIVGEGYHDHAGDPHAEVMALAAAGSSAQGSTVYVTLEPCSHHGRTPPCTDALIGAGVAKVVSAVHDPNPKASGGLEILRLAGIETESGLLMDEARAVNVAWLTAMERGRPYVTVKAAVTLDGFMARSDGKSKWITGEASRRSARLLRAEMGAVVVGRGTVEADDPELTSREKDVVNEPVRAVIDPDGKLQGDERVFTGPGQAQWFVRAGRAVDTRQTPVPDEGDMASAVLDHLFTIGVTGVLVEGGPETIRRFAQAGLADRLILFVGPAVFGSGIGFPFGSFGACGLVLMRAFQSEGDAVLEYACVLTENTLK